MPCARSTRSAYSVCALLRMTSRTCHVVRRRQSGSQRYPENFERRDAGNARQWWWFWRFAFTSRVDTNYFLRLGAIQLQVIGSRPVFNIELAAFVSEINNDILHGKKFILPLLTAKYNHTKYKGKIEFLKTNTINALRFLLKTRTLQRHCKVWFGYCHVCCLSVCLQRECFVTKRLNLGSRSFH